MIWLFLTISSTFEGFWVLSLKATHGFTRFKPIILYAICGAGSAFFLSQAMKSLPALIAYSIWFGGAVIVTLLIEVFYYHHKYSYQSLFFILLILIGVIGTKMTVGVGGESGGGSP